MGVTVVAGDEEGMRRDVVSSAGMFVVIRAAKISITSAACNRQCIDRRNAQAKADAFVCVVYFAVHCPLLSLVPDGRRSASHLTVWWTATYSLLN